MTVAKMNISVLANRDLASNIALNQLFKAAPQHQYSIFLSAQVGSAKPDNDALAGLAFIERHLFNQIVFPSMKATATVKKGRQFSQLKSFEQFSELGFSATDISAVNSKAGIAAIQATDPQLIISIRFGQILKSQIIEIPEYGVLNLHSGILPNYKGVMASFWSMLNDEKHIGTTLHYIDDAQIDTGKIIKIDRQALDYNKCYLANALSLYSTGVNSLVATIGDIAAGHEIQAIKQQTSGRYFTFPEQADIELFRQKGYSLFNYDHIIQIARDYLT